MAAGVPVVHDSRRERRPAAPAAKPPFPSGGLVRTVPRRRRRRSSGRGSPAPGHDGDWAVAARSGGRVPVVPGTGSRPRHAGAGATRRANWRRAHRAARRSVPGRLRRPEWQRPVASCHSPYTVPPVRRAPNRTPDSASARAPATPTRRPRRRSSPCQRRPGHRPIRCDRRPRPTCHSRPRPGVRFRSVPPRVLPGRSPRRSPRTRRAGRRWSHRRSCCQRRTSRCPEQPQQSGLTARHASRRRAPCHRPSRTGPRRPHASRRMDTPSRRHHRHDSLDVDKFGSGRQISSCTDRCTQRLWASVPNSGDDAPPRLALHARDCLHRWL